MPEEFLINKAYHCEVILTNVSPKEHTFSVLYQIPQGSLPLKKSKYLKSKQFTMDKYTTLKVKFEFYFPKAGLFSHLPSNVSIDGKVKAFSLSHKLNVVDKLTVNKNETFQDLLKLADYQD